MTVWSHLSTIFNRRYALRFAVILALCVALTTTLFLSSVTRAVEGVNQTIGFQGRLLDSNGNVVADGFYNIQFKIYQDGAGTAANNPGGSLEWTETYINNGGNNGVAVKNGYLSVNLGSQTPFGSSVDWNQDTLWLSMNVAGSSTSCTTYGSSPCVADGEMLPMKRLTSTPYALNSGKLGGISADGFIQNGTSSQTGDFNISGTGVANTLQGNTSVIAPMFDTVGNDTLSIGSVNAAQVNVATLDDDQIVNIGTGNGDKAVTVGSGFGQSELTLQGGTNGVSIASAGSISLSTDSVGTESLLINEDGDIVFRLAENGIQSTRSSTDAALLDIEDNGDITTGSSTQLNVLGGAAFSNGISIQGGGVNLLNATNNAGSANVGIGNAGNSGYALDVTGDVNSSSQYRINGDTLLTASTLAFGGSSTSSITSANGQSLNLNSSENVTIQTDGATRASFSDANIQIGDGDGSGTPTVLTLDKNTAAPGLSGSTYLGSMYYDSTLGKVQCYEADGWGGCSSSPDTYVTMNPSYANAVISTTGTGTFITDFCSDALNVNDGSSGQPSYCSTNQTFNMYAWNSSSGSNQTRNIYVNYKLPANFKNFVSGTTNLTAARTSLASTTFEIFKLSGTSTTACGSAMSVSATSTWEVLTASGSADPANCSFAAGDSIILKIGLTARSGASASASTLGFAYSDD